MCLLTKSFCLSFIKLFRLFFKVYGNEFLFFIYYFQCGSKDVKFNVLGAVVFEIMLVQYSFNDVNIDNLVSLCYFDCAL